MSAARPRPALSETDPSPGQDGAIHVVFGANAAYLQHTAVCIASLAESNPGRDVCTHVLTCEEASDEEDRLQRMAAVYPRLSVRFHTIDPSWTQGLYVERYFSKEVYLRILAAEVLPAEIRRFIYLDSDTLVVDDIGALWDVDLGTDLFGAVRDIDILGLSGDRFENIGLRPEDTYINSGVMLVDADGWRRERITHRLVEYAIERGSRLKFVDQDAINGSLQGRITVLDFRWNLQVISYGRRVRRYHREYYEASREARRNPAILHFTSGSKPWNFRAWCHKKALYFRFRDKTPWRHERPPRLTAAQRVEYDAARAILRLGFDVYVFRQLAATAAELASALAAPFRVSLEVASARSKRSPSRGRD